MLRNVEQCGVLKGSFCLCMDVVERILGVMGDSLIELVVVLVGELGFRPFPQGRA